jgi:mRNA interferase RelE/StbE
MFRVEWHPEALKELEKLDSFIAKIILKRLDELAENPFSKDIKRLVGREEYRFRVGEYRILFIIENSKIIILKLGHRKNIYDL